jgi:hypothetical protein
VIEMQRETDEESKEAEERMRECEEADKQEKVKEALKTLARRIKENSGIDWNQKNLGCEICNGIVEQPQSSDERNPGLCDDCRELVVRLSAK